MTLDETQQHVLADLAVIRQSDVIEDKGRNGAYLISEALLMDLIGLAYTHGEMQANRQAVDIIGSVLDKSPEPIFEQRIET